MTERQALQVVIDGIETSRDTAALISAAHERYVVYRTTDDARFAVCETSEPNYARSVRLQVGGEIVDRHNWRTR